MFFAAGNSSLSNNLRFSSSFMALFEALNSTGSVINWNTNKDSSSIIPISINLYEKMAPINMAKYPRWVHIFTVGTILLLIRIGL